MPLHKVFALLSSLELSFFAALNAELAKIEGFYLDREREMQFRSKMLETQLKELGDHGRLVGVRTHSTRGALGGRLNKLNE